MFSQFVECAECGFVLMAADGSSPEPLNWEVCPDCRGEIFEFTGE